MSLAKWSSLNLLTEEDDSLGPNLVLGKQGNKLSPALLLLLCKSHLVNNELLIFYKVEEYIEVLLFTGFL